MLHAVLFCSFDEFVINANECKLTHITKSEGKQWMGRSPGTQMNPRLLYLFLVGLCNRSSNSRRWHNSTWRGYGNNRIRHELEGCIKHHWGGVQCNQDIHSVMVSIGQDEEHQRNQQWPEQCIHQQSVYCTCIVASTQGSNVIM